MLENRDMPTFPSYYTHQILSILIFIILLQYYQSTSISASRTLLNINANEEDHQNSTTDTDFVKQSCNNTTYPDLCCSTLSNYTNLIQNNPKELACAALNVTLSEAQVASRVIKAKSGRAKGNNTTTKGKRRAYAMKDCVEVLKDALDELKMSVEEMERASPEESDFRFRVNNVQTWVSAALTDDDTCMDGLEQGGKNTEDYKRIRDEVVKVAHLTSVALALINNYAATFHFLKNLGS